MFSWRGCPATCAFDVLFVLLFPVGACDSSANASVLTHSCPFTSSFGVGTPSTVANQANLRQIQQNKNENVV